jgi:hypothetical protein
VSIETRHEEARGEPMSYEQCIEHLIDTDGLLMTWVKIVVPLLVSTVTVALTIWYTTRKERVALREKLVRAKAMEPKVRQLIDDLVLEAEQVKTATQYNELFSGAKSTVDFAEFGRGDVQAYDIESFPRYLMLLRVAYHFRGTPQAFFENKGIWQSPNRDLESIGQAVRLVREIKNDLERYDLRYAKSKILAEA